MTEKIVECMAVIRLLQELVKGLSEALRIATDKFTEEQQARREVTTELEGERELRVQALASLVQAKEDLSRAVCKKVTIAEAYEELSGASQLRLHVYLLQKRQVELLLDALDDCQNASDMAEVEEIVRAALVAHEALESLK